MIVICAHYTVFTAEEILEMRAIIDEISRRFGTDAVNTREVRPTDTAPVLTLIDNQLIASPASWGFPKWYGKGVEINARSETALQKPMFSKAILTRRCVIPSTGFYECEDWISSDVFMREVLTRTCAGLEWKIAG